MDKNEAIKIIRSNYPTGRNQLCEALETLIPELKESEDERIRKALIHLISEQDGYLTAITGISVMNILVWLENQCNTDSIIEKAKTEKQRVIITETDGNANIDWDTRSLEDARSLLEYGWQYINTELEKHGEQNHADKIEPKFNVGDWIVSNRTNKTYKIDSIDTKDANYIIYSCVPSVYTNEDSPCFSESMIHLWTVQDAKDGDVLACPSGWTCIFKSLYGDTFSSYCFIDKTGWFCEIGSECHTLNKEFIKAYNGEIKPATKEQRDLLFQKMKEAGYEWDAEKKELKKIEQKSTWSEEDENLYTQCMSAIQTRFNDGLFTTNEYRQTSLWLKSLKERMKGK